MPDTDGFVELSEAIAAVREQLIDARDEGVRSGAAGQVAFAVESVTIEFSGELRKTGGAKGGVKFWVASVEASGELSKVTTQRVTVQLRPHGAEGSGVDISGALDAVPPR